MCVYATCKYLNGNKSVIFLVTCETCYYHFVYSLLSNHQFIQLFFLSVKTFLIKYGRDEARVHSSLTLSFLFSCLINKKMNILM